MYEINARRKRSQLNAGEQLNELSNKWVELVSKNARIEVEIINLENEVNNSEKLKNLNCNN